MPQEDVKPIVSEFTAVALIDYPGDVLVSLRDVAPHLLLLLLIPALDAESAAPSFCCFVFLRL